MPRKPRIHFPGALYHVIARGNQRQKTFHGVGDYEKYLARLQYYRPRYDFRLYAFALMPNHVHLLIEVGQVPLAKIMQGLQFSYTQYFNRHYRKIGHLFHGRYRAILCVKDSYLLALIRYIHLNPLRARLVPTVRALTAYPWTSLPDYLSCDETRGVAVGDVLPIFGKRKATARAAFLSFLQDAAALGHQEQFYAVKDQRILGDEEFAEAVLKAESADDEPHYQVTLPLIVEHVCAHFAVHPTALRSAGRPRHLAFVRALIAYLNRTVRGGTIAEVARACRRTPHAVILKVREIESCLRTDVKLQTLVDRLRDACIAGQKRKL